MKRTRLHIVLMAMLFVLALSGCYGKRVHDLELDMYRREAEISRLQDSLYHINQTVAHLDTTVGAESAPVRASAATSEARLDEIQTRLEILESLVKENRYKIAQFSLLSVPMRADGDTASALGDTTMAQASVATHVYETAYMDFTRGDYVSAIDGFREFVRRFPMTDFSDDAQFMIAQSFYTQRDYPNAIIEFRKVVDSYPSGDKVPEAMYRLGLSYQEIDDTDTARQYFKILVNRYPNSPESKRAQELLEGLPEDQD
ncbi:MAG: tol-pal system protein YbgF [bacterium]|jgi:tol-pal system protein YbgF